MYRGYTKSWRKKYGGRTASRGVVYLGAMDWFVGNANWSNRWYGGMEIKRGQILVGRKKLAETWVISEQSVRTILQNLQRDGFLTTHSTSIGTVVTVLNFDTYQSNEEANQPTNQPPTNHQSTTNQPLLYNIKNNKELKEGYPASVDDIIEIAQSPQCGVIMTREQAEVYFINRMSTDWVDASNRKINANKVPYDIKRWLLRENKAQEPNTNKNILTKNPDFSESERGS